MKIIENDDKIKVLKKYFDNNFPKEDLERYYIDEGKSMLEISRIYGCSNTTIKNKLRKYGIFIRPHGAFLVDDDGETLKSKYNKGEISLSEYDNERVKSKGFDNRSDHDNEQAKKKGYKNNNDYSQKMCYKRGIGSGLSMSENKESSQYLGIYICENKEFLRKIINIVESMPNNNPGYDVVCTKGKKIDVKCSCLRKNKE